MSRQAQLIQPVRNPASAARKAACALAMHDGHASAPPVVGAVLRSPGQPLPPSTRGWMETRFGHNLDRVRVHSDAHAGEAALALGARAFTVGSDVVFAPGQYAPHHRAGRQLLAHELVHAQQQERAGAASLPLRVLPVGDALEAEASAVANRICRDGEQARRPPPAISLGQSPLLSPARFTVGSAVVEIDYGDVIHVAPDQYESAIETRFASWTGQPASTIHADLVALTASQKEWLLFALDLLVENPATGLNQTEAVWRLIAYAPSARFRALGTSGTHLFDFENEVLSVSGWFERALTSGLAAPTGARLRAVQDYINPSGGGGGSSTCPASRPADQQLDTARLQSDLPTQLETYLQQVAPPAGVTAQAMGPIQTIADAVQTEAIRFFSPYADRGRGRGNTLVQNWQYSAHMVGTHTPAGAPTQEARLAYLDSRARSVGGRGLFAQVHFDSRCSADEGALAGIVQNMETQANIQSLVNRILEQISYTEQSATPKRVFLNVQYNPAMLDECEARWRTINTLCHELVHVMAHDEFRASAAGRQILVEGFTEVLGDQLYDDIRARADSDAAYRARFEAGLTGAPCGSIPASSTGYGAAGTNAERIRILVGNDRFRAAYFLGRLELVGIQPKLKVAAAPDNAENEADCVAEQVVRRAPVDARSVLTSLLARPASTGAALCLEGGSPILDEAFQSSGQTLDNRTRAFMEARFAHSFDRVRVRACPARNLDGALTVGPADDGFEGEARGMALRVSEPNGRDSAAEPCDFSQVRIHSDNRAAESAEALRARAYTVGSHIFFGPGQYQPDSNEGRRLLAHELTHVVQHSRVPAFSPQRLSREPAPGAEADTASAAPASAPPVKSAGELARPANKLMWKWNDLLAYPLLVDIWKDVVWKQITAKERADMRLTGGESSAFFLWASAIGLAGGGLGGGKLQGDLGKDWETTKTYAEALQPLTLSNDVMMDGLSRIVGLRLDKYLESDLFKLRLKNHSASVTALFLLAQGIYSTVQAARQPSEGPGELTELQWSKQIGLIRALAGAILKEQLKAPDFFDVGPLQMKTHPAFAAAPFAGGAVPSGVTTEGKTGVGESGGALKLGLTLNLPRLAGREDVGDLTKYRGWQASLWFTGEHLDPTRMMREAGKLPETKLRGGTLFGAAGHLFLLEGGARLAGDQANAVTSWFLRGGYGYGGEKGSVLQRIGFTATYVDWTESDALAPGREAGAPSAGRAVQVTPFAKLQLKGPSSRHQFDVGAALAFVSGSQERFGVSGFRGDFTYTYLGTQGSAGLPAFKLDLSGSLNRLDWWNPNSPLLWGVQAKVSVNRFFGGAQVMGGAGAIPESRAALIGETAKVRVPTAVLFTGGYAF